jgi:branched-chain amino acid transport system permease protein
MQTRSFPDVTTLVVLIALLGLPLVVSTTLASQIAILALGALSVSVLLGGVGMLSFGQGLYLGIGSYTAGILMRDFHFGLALSLAAAVVGGGIAACAVGSLIVRRQGVYFVMLTLAFAQMGYFAMLAFKQVTNGENGITGIPRAFDVFGMTIDGVGSMYVLTAGIFFIVFLATQRLLASPFGSVLASIKQNEARSEALGYAVGLYKTAAFAFSGAIAGLAGALHVVSLGCVSPNDIELEMSQRLLVMAIIGGVSSPGGAFAGALFYAVASETLSTIWPRWLALVALLLIAIVLFVPGGLWSLGSRLADSARSRKTIGGRKHA